MSLVDKIKQNGKQWAKDATAMAKYQADFAVFLADCLVEVPFKQAQILVNCCKIADAIAEYYDNNVNNPLDFITKAGGAGFVAKRYLIANCQTVPDVTVDSNSTVNNYNSSLHVSNYYSNYNYSQNNTTVNVSITNLPPLPLLPERRQPPYAPQDKQAPPGKDYTSRVCETMSKRKWGCLLHKPINTAPWGVARCADDPQTFWDSIAQETEAMLTAITDPNTDIEQLHYRYYGFLLYVMPFIRTTIPFFGIESVKRLMEWYVLRSRYIDNFRQSIGGSLYINGTEELACTVDELYTSLANNIYDKLTVNCSDATNCGIPIDLYESDTGYSVDQLHIEWRNYDWTPKNRYPKVTGLPAPLPIDQISTELLQQTLPPVRNFGKTLYEIDFKHDNVPDVTRAVSRVRLFGTGITEAEQQAEIDEYLTYVTALCEPTMVTFKTWRSKQYKSLNVWTGDCFPYRAVYLAWDAEKNRWECKAAWYIYRSAAQASKASSGV